MSNITILWNAWSSYMDASAKALAESTDGNVTIVYGSTMRDAPYKPTEFFNYGCRAIAIDLNETRLPDEVTSVPTDGIVVCGWNVPLFRNFAMASRGKMARILCIDNQWRGSLRQWGGVLASPFYVQPAYDAAFVPGRRQAEFVRRLGFAAENVVEGHYACDFAHFNAVYAERLGRPLTRNFVFVGRLVPEKAIKTLLAAWRRFVVQGTNGWTLTIVGSGSELDNEVLPPHLSVMDFVQPSQLPAKFLDGDVFVLPSIFEPWGLVLHEAASAGMPIICSDACGAGDAYVRSDINGRIVRAGSEDDLAEAFAYFSRLDDASVRAMAAQSVKLAAMRKPSDWAANVLSIIARHKATAHP